MNLYVPIDFGTLERRFEIQIQVQYRFIYLNNRAYIQQRFSFEGLLSVSIKPDGRFLGEDFPVGINETVPVEQSVSCCTTGVDITALDVRGNTVHCRADQCKLDKSNSKFTNSFQYST